MREKRMILIGEAESKRTKFFLKAADRQQVPVEFCTWSEWKKKDIEGGVVKIDPPSFQEYNILQLPKRIQGYREQLLELEEKGNRKEVCFLNPPTGILQLLDKVSCKEKLKKYQLPVTTMVAKNIKNYLELKEKMLEKRVCSVFLKPVYGSGAAGILAFSINPVTGKVVAYTAANVEGDTLFQQKKIRKITKEKEVETIVNAIASLETIVERWYPKATLEGNPFDFRVLWQFGQIECIICRKSVTPITNLHLNNGAIALEKVLQSDEDWNKGTIQNDLARVCEEAMALFPTMHMAGIDIMLDKKTGRPRIIEMNGQGDLLYQDIYGKNKIYSRQVVQMNHKCDRFY